MKTSFSNLIAAIAGFMALAGAAEARNFVRSEDEQLRAGAEERVLLDSSLSVQGMYKPGSGSGASAKSGKTKSGKESGKSGKGGKSGGEGEFVVQRARLGVYPGYEGDVEVSGRVRVKYIGNEGALQYMRFSFDLEGVEADCVDCGIHIHAGTSCASDELVMGHSWNSAEVNDHWTTAGGAVYNSDGDGNASGSFYITNGFGPEENLHHAVVVHGQDSTRVGCGILK